MIKKIILILLIIVSLSVYALASTTADITQGGVGARPLGMGKAFVAVPDGANAISFNPAAIGFVQTIEITTMQNKIFDSLDFKMYSGVLATTYGNIGINYILTEVPAGYETTDKDSLSSAKPITYKSSMVTISYGMNMAHLIHTSSTMGYLSFGGNIKLLRNDLSASTKGVGTGFDADVGALLTTPIDLTLGISFQNFLQRGIDWTSGNKDTLPFIVKYGATYTFKRQKILIAIDGESFLSTPHPFIFHAGMEWTPIPLLILRAGIDQDAVNQTEVLSNITFGAGLKIKAFIFDYAYRQEGLTQNTSAHYFSMSYSP